jgi:hypothetical protein
LPGQDAWTTPELLDDEELEDEELDEEELDEDELEDELDEDELDDEPVGFAPPQPATVNSDNTQALAIANFAVYTVFMQPLSLLLDDFVLLDDDVLLDDLARLSLSFK